MARPRIGEPWPAESGGPPVLGADQRLASLTLRRAGLEVGATARLPWTGATPGTVISQDPPPHAQGISRPSVDLLVAAPDDEAPDGFVMPDLTGLLLASAQAQLAKVGIQSAPPLHVNLPIPPVGTATLHPGLPSSRAL